MFGNARRFVGRPDADGYVVGADRSERVGRDTPVSARVRVALVVNNVQEKERAARQEHAIACDAHFVTILVPLDDGRGIAVGFAVERRGLVLANADIMWVLGDNRWPEFA